MKSSEKRLLILATISVCSISFVLFIALFLVNFSAMLPLVKVAFFCLFFIIFIFSIYMTIHYLLSPMFKTNYLLELLLKDTLHELNIPLSVIKANLQMLRMNEKDSKKLKRLDRVGLACVDLDRLYKDMDYYIKREVRYDLKENFDVKDVIEEVKEKVEAQGLHVKIESSVESLHVNADKHGFIKAIGNLVDNAIKYNKNGKSINLSLKNGKLNIEDQGIGMDESEIFRVFDRYYQSDDSKKGVGIGLNIVKNYCDESKIFINIFSKKGKGTKISLDLKNILLEQNQ
ncbi:sensor histidine kinase [Sulfurospirillum arcachonense]|uniref:sensor histidine kinase n=1 Tax=Sulfurospirillum arcachonense TaxID=57666 RepID=UPI00056C3905|nr:HAMP domain-containing sensor histidine kinase [Sulfurospirillum arcachonense]